MSDRPAGLSERGMEAAARVLAMQDRAGEDRWAQQPAEVRDAYLDLARRAFAAAAVSPVSVEGQQGVIERITTAAKGVGYAVAVHGSRARDLDLIAVAWTEDAGTVQQLLDAIQEADFIYGPDNPKPHGRVGFQVHGVPGSAGIKYVDLSVIGPSRVEGEDERMPVFTIKAKDNLALDTIRHYAMLCTEHGLHDQAREVGKAFDEVDDWRQAHPDRLKDPDHKHVPTAAVEGEDEGKKPAEAPEAVVVAFAREIYRQDTKCGNADYDVDFDALPHEERESRLCEAEANVLFIMDRLAAASPSSPTGPTTEDEIERAAKAAFFQDDLGGHIAGRWTWDTIPDEGRENYRTMIRAALTAAREVPDDA